MQHGILSGICMLLSTHMHLAMDIRIVYRVSAGHYDCTAHRKPVDTLCLYCVVLQWCEALVRACWMIMIR